MNQKKKYMKPELEFVNFVMSSNIAGTCAFDTASHADGNTCEFPSNGWVIYSSSNADCTLPVSDPKFCYHVPSDGINIFQS